MSDSSISNSGYLSVDIDSTSWYFSNRSPVKIRDGDMRLVRYEDNIRNFELPPGLYQVSAVLEDGQEHKRVVEIKAGQDAKVTIGGSKERLPLESYLKERIDRPTLIGLSGFTPRIKKIDGDAKETISPDLDADLLEIKGAKILSKTRGLWILNCTDTIEVVPTAKLKVGKKEVIISLPTSPQGSATANFCALRIDNSPSGKRASAWISPERTVANAFQNMLASGQILNAAHMAADAVELLRDKYSDPTGAVLGALILNKFGRLTDREFWVKNLAKDFAWIPDGKILLASLKASKHIDLDSALRLAIDASRQRILYTESYSILLDMLRRWPSKDDRNIRYDAIANLASHSPFIDWDSICLSRNLKVESND